MNKYGKGTLDQIWTVFRGVYHVIFQRVLTNATFWTFVSPRFSDSGSWKIHLPWGLSFNWKSSKFNLNFESEKKNSKKVFCFWDSWIWIWCYKLSLLRIEYFSSAVNMSTNSPKILHIPKRNFFQLNCLHSDQ